MSFLSEAELASLAPAESTLFRSPIPVQSVSSDEFMPSPQSAKQREFEARVKRLGSELAKRHGMQSTMADPRVCAFMMGTLVKGLGADHVVWGTDAIWTGSPQWQIEALRRLEIPEEMRKTYGFAPLGAADGPVKRAILGENNARLYGYSAAKRAALANDKVVYWKGLYEKHGEGRTNLAYGYTLAGA